MRIRVPISNRVEADRSGINVGHTRITALEIKMDVENGRRVMDKLHEKGHKLMEQDLTSEYIIIDRKSYMDLCAYQEDMHSRIYAPNPGKSMWITNMYLSSGEVTFIVLPQDKTRIQVIPKTEDVLFRMNR